MSKKYVSPSKLSVFLDGCKNLFANITHKHTISDITDYTVDSQLSSTSTNPVQNKTINAEFDSMVTAMNALDAAIDEKADSEHIHAISDVTNLQSSLDAKVPTSRTVNGKALSANITLSASDVGAAASSHTHSSYVNQNAFSNVKVGETTVAADTTTDTLEIAAGTGISVVGDATNDKVTITNSGVRSISTGSSNGTISVNTNGTSANVAVKGLGSAAYTASTAYDASGTAQTKADAALASANAYTDTAISNLINSAPTTLDTLGEIATAMEENADVVSALEDAIGTKVDKVSGKGLSTNDYTTTEKNKLAGIASGAQVNQNAFSNVKVGDTTIAADTTTDTLTLIAGSNITLTPDATGDSVTIAAKDTTYSLSSFGVTATATELNKMDGVTATTTELNYVDGVTSNIQTQLDSKAASGHSHSTATTSANGFMSSSDKSKLDGIASGANAYTHPTTSGNKHIPSGGSSGQILRWSADGTAVWGSDNNTTYGVATSSALGLVKSGTDITVDSSGNVSVNDDSHNHTIANVDNLQSSLDAKQATITGGASTITSSNLTASRALVSDSSGKVAVSAVTSTELGYLDGVTSGIQAQLDSKSNSSHTHTGLNYIANVTSDVQTQLNAKSTATNIANGTGTKSLLANGATTASGQYSLAEGQSTTASGDSSHAEGYKSVASGSYSHAEGRQTNAVGKYSHSEGYGTSTTINLTGDASAKTYTVSAANSEIRVGRMLQYGTTYARITAYDSSALTVTTSVTLSSSALSSASVTLHRGISYGQESHSEGYYTTASGEASHAEGYHTIASGSRSHAEGSYTNATGIYSHAEGENTTASLSNAHAEGSGTLASGGSSHAEGSNTTASGSNSHAQGYNTTASASYSHAEGGNTVASGAGSHAEGYGTIAKGESQHVQGEYNIEDTSNTYAHIVGNGSSSTRSNAHTLDWNGNAWFAGNVYVGGTSQSDAIKLPSVKAVTASAYTALGTTVSSDGVLYLVN